MEEKKPKLESAIDKRAETILTKALERIKQGKRVNIKQLMLDAGYSETSAYNQSIKRSKAWQRALNKIKDYKILNRFQKIAMGKVKGGGVREQIQAGVEVIKLKDRYPDKKLRIGAFDDREKVIDAPKEVKKIESDENSQREKTPS